MNLQQSCLPYDGDQCGTHALRKRALPNDSNSNIFNFHESFSNTIETGFDDLAYLGSHVRLDHAVVDTRNLEDHESKVSVTHDPTSSRRRQDLGDGDSLCTAAEKHVILIDLSLLLELSRCDSDDGEENFDDDSLFAPDSIGITKARHIRKLEKNEETTCCCEQVEKEECKV